jgi:hypothetical protein
MMGLIDEWRKIYGEGSGYLLTLHVPVAFIKHKNELSRAMYRIGKKYRCNIKICSSH